MASDPVQPARLDEHQERVEGDTNQSPLRQAYQSKHLDARTHEILAEDGEYFLHQSLSTPCIDVLEEAEGVYLHNASGRKLMDFHGNGVHHVGFRNPRVIEAVKQQLDRMPFCTRRYTNQPAIDLARKMREITPGKLSQALFAPGGTSAVGMAMKLARLATGRYKTVSMWGSFHGASIDVISVGGQSLFSGGLGPLLPGAIHVRPPVSEGCPFGCKDVCNANCTSYIREVFENEGDIAALIAEPIRWSTVTVPAPEYWQTVRELCDKHGVLLIFDEIGTALGRTGKMFAFEHFDVEPDIVVLGKGFGGGVMPLAGIVAREGLNIAGDRAIGHYTHEKNPVSCTAGLATIKCIEEDGLVARSAELGEATLARLRRFAETSSGRIRTVRGAGLLMGVELAETAETGPSHQFAERVMYRSMARGLSFKVSSGNVLTLCPPLTISDDEMKQAIDILEASINEG